jgi:hypothetical protein
MEKLETQESRGLIDFLCSNIGSVTVPVPQIVVVGNTSAGKSSVLTALSGIEFPSADAPCTRCPIQLRLCRRDCDFVCRISLEYPPQVHEDEVRPMFYRIKSN